MEAFLDGEETPTANQQPPTPQDPAPPPEVGGPYAVYDILGLPRPEPISGARVYCVPLTQSALAPYTPRDTRRGIETARELLTRGPYAFDHLLGSTLRDTPAVYALYYCGDLEVYALQRDETSRMPIYIGSAGKVLHRVRTHAKSISRASNLELRDFTVRILPMPGEYREESETRLQRLYGTLWNDTLKGFGSRQGSADRRAATSRRSRWDCVHPGREGAGGRPRSGDFDVIIADAIPACLERYRRVERLLDLDRELTEADL